MWTKQYSSYLTDGCWSPIRSSVFFITKMDGTLDVWDMIFKQNNPALSLQVCDVPLHSLRINETGKFIAAGSEDGTTTLLELSESLYTQARNERNLVTSIFERETRREKILDARHREIRLKERAKTAGSKHEGEETAVKEEEAVIHDEDLYAQAEKTFFNVVGEEKKKWSAPDEGINHVGKISHDEDNDEEKTNGHPESENKY
uniref:Dynein intermediate chain 3, ciliary n=1 Tax=Arion vulgaris TaxID=1028688 RepID=A0A0B7A5S6_9EUPU